MAKWTKLETEFLIKEYPIKGKYYCAEKLNRSESSIRAKTSEMKIFLSKTSEFYKEFQKKTAKGKIGNKRPEHSALMKTYAKMGKLPVLTNRTSEQFEKQRQSVLSWYRNNEHPKGMLGKQHTFELKTMMSNKSINMWKDPKSKVNTIEHRQYLSDSLIKNRDKVVPKTLYSRAKSGWIEIGGKKYFYRSSWEPNIAAYLEFLKKQNKIKDWTYEEDTFWFNEIKRGVRSYKPDFKITQNDGTIYYEEVKGWMDGKSKTKLNRMRIYYPEIDIRVLCEDRYKSISKMKSFIPNWGMLPANY